MGARFVRPRTGPRVITGPGQERASLSAHSDAPADATAPGRSADPMAPAGRSVAAGDVSVIERRQLAPADD